MLPAASADDPERLARFTREAQTLASLNHPNIAAIYGLENVGAPLVGALDAALVGALDAIPDTRDRAGTRPAPTGSTIALVMEPVEGEDLSAPIDALPMARVDGGRGASDQDRALPCALPSKLPD